MKRDFISVIVPIYNQEKYLDNCINQLLNQTYKNYEIILINDGSNDDSFNICKKYFNKKNVRYYHKKNGGVSSARNLGLKYALGEYCVFVDCDDTYSKYYLKKLLDGILVSDCDLCVCNYTTNNNELSLKQEKDKILNKQETFNYLSSNKKFGGYVWNKIYKLNIINKYNILFDENIHSCEDYLFNSEYIKYIRNTNYINDNLYLYNLNNQQSISVYNKICNNKKKSILLAYEQIIEIFRKNSPNNLIYIYINYLKILLYIYFIDNKDNKKIIKNKMRKVWKIVKKSRIINIKTKFIIFLRVTFPYSTEYIRYIIGGRKWLKK